MILRSPLSLAKEAEKTKVCRVQSAEIEKFLPGRSHCPRCESEDWIKKGYFKTLWNGQWVPRYRCRACGKYFSSHTRRASFRQHRPDLNQLIWDAYASGMTLRRMARVFRVDRKTVVRKFLYLASLARVVHERKLEDRIEKAHEVQFDEMETFEHTKLKPIAISVGVIAKTGEIVDLRAETLHYKGPLAALAFRKYGKREIHRLQAHLDLYLAWNNRYRLPP